MAPHLRSALVSLSAPSLILFTFLGGGCSGASLESGEDSPSAYGGGDDDGDSYAGDDDDDGGVVADDDSAPPEDETNDFLTAAPVGVDQYVFVVNTERDTVSKINANTLSVLTLPTGSRPIQVEATEDGTRAVIFNADSDDLTVLDVATDALSQVAVREDLNTLALSPDGRHAVCYYDADNAEDDPHGSGTWSLNDVTVVDLDSLTTTSFAVGFQPLEVEFTPDGTLAVMVSDGTLALLDLSVPVEDIVSQQVLISEDQLDPPVVEEVELAQDGTFAFARVRSENKIVAVDLMTHAVSDIPAGDDPSDMDLTPDGEAMVVVSRGTQEILVYDAHTPDEEPVVVAVPADLTAGAIYLSPTGQGAVVYSTAVAQDRFGYWMVGEEEITVHPLVKPVAAARIAQDGESVVFFHTLEDVPDAGEDDYTNRESLSLVRLSDFLVQPVILEAEVTAYTDSEDGHYAVFLMDQSRSVGVIDYPHLLVDDVVVPSPPRYIGMLPVGELAYVSQDHSLGRITFLDPSTLDTSTLTGFELNGEIE